jgi:hypothetical protein
MVLACVRWLRPAKSMKAAHLTSVDDAFGAPILYQEAVALVAAGSVRGWGVREEIVVWS